MVTSDHLPDQVKFPDWYSANNGGAENARLENAGLENVASNCRTGKHGTGKRENGLVMESRSSLNSRHTARR